MIKGEKMNKARILSGGYLVLLTMLCVNMGESKQQNSLQTVHFHQLKEKEGCFHATIFDAGHKIEVRNFSFAGYATLGGVLKESDDSVNKIDLAEVKEIIINNQFYTGQRYKNLELLQATIVTKNGKTISDWLIPRNVEISGVEISTQIQKAWNLCKVEKIVIQGPCKLINEEAEARKFAEQMAQKAAPKPTIAQQKQNSTDIKTASENLQVLKLEEEQIPAPVMNEKKGIVASFIHLIDAILGIVKALARAVMSLFGFIK